ncbi:Holliday junction branch migration protein RuvA [Candidatus Neomarinimicrobiota bacterium]
MIVRLSGSILEKAPDHLVLDVHGVGYHVWITVNTYEQLPSVGESVVLLTYMQVRDDGQDLFGFLEKEERQLFKSLIGISGIGAKTAVTILSGARPDVFRHRVQEGDETALTSIRGVGPKMARRIITELRDALGASVSEIGSLPVGQNLEAFQEAVQSLVALGYRQSDARIAVIRAAKRLKNNAPVEDLIRSALGGG